MRRLTLLLLLMVSTSVFAWSLFGPTNFDECISEKLKGISSDMAARIIYEVCDDKFNNGNKDKKLNDCVLENIKGISSDMAAKMMYEVCENKK